MVEVAEHLKGRDFILIGGWSSDELKTVLDLADELKGLQAKREPHELLPGRMVGLIFQKPSTERASRPRSASPSSGARPRPHRPATSSSAAARRSRTRDVLERYLDAIMIRISTQEDVESWRSTPTSR